jgi:hypothetical protein
MSTTLEPALDPQNPGEWVLVEDTPDFRRYELDVGDGTLIRRTEHKHTEALLEANARARASNAGKRWGDGQVVGSIPMNLYYSSGMAEASKQRDKTFQKRFWNDLDHRKLRTFEGQV